MANIDRLKADIVASLDIQSFYEKHLSGQSLREKADGWSDRVLCPIHNDQSKPNFFVNLRTGGFKCHACGASGSMFDFWLHMEGLSIEDRTNFQKALVALATEANIDVKAWSEDPSRKSITAPVGASTRQKKDYIPKVNKADANDAVSKPITIATVKGYHKALRAEHYKFLNQHRGLRKDTIEEYLIGWNVESFGKTPEGDFFKGRYSIPIKDKKGLVRNVRNYSQRCSSAFKMINTKGYGSPSRLFPLERLLAEDWEYVVICEGEWDAILLNQELKKLGLSTWGAMSGTAGAKNFEPEWLPYLFGRHIMLCYDCDEPGKTAATTHASKFFLPAIKAGKFREVKIVDLGLDGSKESKDITDFFLKAGFDAEDFLTIASECPPLIAGGVTQDEATREATEVDSFVSAIKDRRYIDERVTVPLTISGQSNRTYHAVRSYKVVGCPLMDSKSGGECCQRDSGEQLVPYGNELFIQSCMAPKAVIQKELAKVACTHGQKCSCEPIRKVVMEQLFAHQVVKRWKTEEDELGRMQNAQELIQAPIYVLQPPDNLEIGPQNYMATGWIRTDPNTQSATLFAETLVPLEDDWKKFTLEREEHRKAIEEIKKDWTVDEIIASITNHVTKIYEADDILYAILLSYLSPLWMSFNGSLMRGWINSAIIGDSGTGKSATYTKISDWLDLGDLFSVLSGTRTGLLYAIKQKAGEWHVSIGRYVQASGKIIAVDETQETTPEDIKRMAIAMDTGWLEVSQVASGGYRTQTRTIFMMNPKMGRTISDYSYGCEALKECFDPMFIRRLDLAVFTTSNHEYEFYNQAGDKPKDASAKVLSARLFKALVHWAWTRKIDNILWSQSATQHCLEKATFMSGVYGYADDIPLVSPQDFRNNLARLSVAYAILDRNFTDDLESVNIENRHVDAMANLVDAIYSSTACNLKQRSKQSRRKNALEDYEKIRDNFNQIIENAKSNRSKFYREGNHFVQLLLLLQQLEYIRKKDLREQLNIKLPWVQKKVAILQSYSLLEVSRSGYKTTRKFNLFMQEWQQEAGIEEMLESVHTQIGASMIEDSYDHENYGHNDDGLSIDYEEDYRPSRQANFGDDVSIIEDNLDDPFA